ncbi:peroxiredoxin family protein [Paraferrimonas haliotis]|nr:peroxiredoxin family protein [Paraferrimonas haliotis]
MTKLTALGLLALSHTVAATPFKSDANDVTPLQTGQSIPSVTVTTMAGDDVALTDVVAKSPTVLVFYRGGWCPFCNQQLASLNEVLGQIRANGYQVLAISPDTPERLAKTKTSEEIDYTLLSDSSLNAISGFKLGFFLDDKTAKRYRDRMGQVFVTAEGTNKIVLPVPAVYVIQTDGSISYSYYNPNYRERMDTSELLKVTAAGS